RLCRHAAQTQTDSPNRTIIDAMTLLDSFGALLQAAREQPERQRLLLVFVRTVLPEEASGAQTQRFESGLGGGLVPVMGVDKGAHELNGFDSLAAEARQMGESWDMVLVACMAGHGSHGPAPEVVEESLTQIVRTI